MAKEIRLPQLGQTMEEGTIVDCPVKVGDKVAKGDVIFEIETDKATLEMESPAAGFVKHIGVLVGEVRNDDMCRANQINNILHDLAVFPNRIAPFAAQTTIIARLFDCLENGIEPLLKRHHSCHEFGIRVLVWDLSLLMMMAVRRHGEV